MSKQEPHGFDVIHEYGHKKRIPVPLRIHSFYVGAVTQQQDDRLDRPGRMILAKFFKLADRRLQWRDISATVARFAGFIGIRASGKKCRHAIDVAGLNDLKECVRHGFLTSLPWGGPWRSF